MKNITRYYGNFRALNNISLSVEKGEILGLLGPNGAGKTTAMRILTSFLPATSGTATVAGFDVFEDSLEVRRRLGYLPETPPVYPEMTVESYLNFVGEIKELAGKVRKERIAEIADRIGLTDNLQRIIGHLSKGYRQRVGIAQALLHNPDVLILDEPTVGLDPNQIIEIRGLIKDLAKDHTIILSTHYLAEVSMTCSRVVIINEGEIVAEDSVENLEKGATGATHYKITLKPSESNDWREIIDKTAGTKISAELHEAGLIKFNLELPSEKEFDSMFEKIVAKGTVFREISPVKASLEDVFIKLTSGEERKADA
ncbi:MAG: gliding motility-associated transport system ATP-binding protein [Clostridiales bacterium]|jgi:ABC-2 type transport system ATP-binding protein|nr:gliding motility-associated transport system ATP-binding protein [Clostridiales bacterium]MDN5283039.1 gliding motility-associated transport system ATP-binding protein [Candidatus Ozemobacter sp.]